MKFWATPALLAGALATILAGCAGDPNAFDEGVAKGVAEAEPFQLDSEQVSMNFTQLGCGAGEDLWEAPTNSGERSLSHLEQKGRDLHLTDDVYSSDAEFPNPYTQDLKAFREWFFTRPKTEFSQYSDIFNSINSSYKV